MAKNQPQIHQDQESQTLVDRIEKQASAAHRLATPKRNLTNTSPRTPAASADIPSASAVSARAGSEMRTFLCQNIRVVSRADAAAGLGIPLRKIDSLGINCASQPELCEGRLRYIVSGRDKYFVCADIEVLERRERELRSARPGVRPKPGGTSGGT
jgi:hypothetical protein